MKPQHIAIAYDKRGHVICVAKNSYVKSHPLQAEYARKAGSPGKIFLHAECRAILKAQALGKAVAHLHVTRLDKNGNSMYSKPCKVCQLMIDEFKIKKVTHT